MVYLSKNINIKYYYKIKKVSAKLPFIISITGKLPKMIFSAGGILSFQLNLLRACHTWKHPWGQDAK